MPGTRLEKKIIQTLLYDADRWMEEKRCILKMEAILFDDDPERGRAALTYQHGRLAVRGEGAPR